MHNHAWMESYMANDNLSRRNNMIVNHVQRKGWQVGE